MAKYGNNNIKAAYIPVASNAGDLTAMARANAAFGGAISGIGGDIKTGVTDWAGHETDRAVAYLDSLGSDEERISALSQMQQDPIGAFLDVGTATEAIDAMQLRDFKVDERAEQALKAEDMHKTATQKFDFDKLMNPELINKTKQDTITAKSLNDLTEKKIGSYDDRIKSALNLEKVTTGLKNQTYTAEKKKLDDTTKIGEQWKKLREMPLRGKTNEESSTLSMNQLSVVNEQIKTNESTGTYDDKERLKKFTRQHLTQSEYKISDEQFIAAGVGKTFTPGSHDSLRLAIMSDLARTYTTNTQAELEAHANKIIDTYPGNLKTHFKWGKELADQNYSERKSRMYETGMNKQLKAIQEEQDPKKKLQKISTFKKLNERTAVPPEQTTRFNAATTPVIEEFAASINAEKVFLDSLPPELTGNAEFTKSLRDNTREFGLTDAIRMMDIKQFTPTLQRKIYRNLDSIIQKDLGQMTRAELTPMRNLIMGENPAIMKQFDLNKQIVQTKDKLTAVSQELQVDLAKLDKKTILGFRDNLSETIIKGVEDRAVKLETFDDINPRQLKKSVDDTIGKIKDALGVNSSWSKQNQYALNIAIGGLFQGIRVDPDLDGNDYVLPHIAMGTDIRELPIDVLIEGLKEHLEFASGKVQGAALFDKTVKEYTKNNPTKEEGYYEMILQNSPLGMATEMYDNPSIRNFNAFN